MILDHGCTTEEGSGLGICVWSCDLGCSRYFRMVLLTPGRRHVIEDRIVRTIYTSRYIQCFVSNDPSLLHRPCAVTERGCHGRYDLVSAAANISMSKTSRSAK